MNLDPAGTHRQRDAGEEATDVLPILEQRAFRYAAVHHVMPSIRFVLP